MGKLTELVQANQYRNAMTAPALAELYRLIKAEINKGTTDWELVKEYINDIETLEARNE